MKDLPPHLAEDRPLATDLVEHAPVLTALISQDPLHGPARLPVQHPHLSEELGGCLGRELRRELSDGV
jgi:hypothetical protein